VKHGPGGSNHRHSHSSDPRRLPHNPGFGDTPGYLKSSLGEC
jgi:hypothetical protein